MPRLVTGLFYERSEAERAIEALKSQGVPPESIYLESEVPPTPDVGRKGGEVGRLETERRFAGLETGVIIGLTVGLLAGIGVGMLGGAISELMFRTEAKSGLSPMLANPWLTALSGALLGLIAGGLIGWIVDFTLTRLGAGPPLPKQETLVTVRTDDANLDQVCAALFRARARHMHVAESASA
jgi:hypothetical protein